jgi:hypothetical protein
MTLEVISICGVLCLRRKEATATGGLRFIDIQTRPTEVLDLTSLTLAEFQRVFKIMSNEPGDTP